MSDYIEVEEKRRDKAHRGEIWMRRYHPVSDNDKRAGILQPYQDVYLTITEIRNTLREMDRRSKHEFYMHKWDFYKEKTKFYKELEKLYEENK